MNVDGTRDQMSATTVAAPPQLLLPKLPTPVTASQPSAPSISNQPVASTAPVSSSQSDLKDEGNVLGQAVEVAAQPVSVDTAAASIPAPTEPDALPPASQPSQALGASAELLLALPDAEQAAIEQALEQVADGDGDSSTRELTTQILQLLLSSSNDLNLSLDDLPSDPEELSKFVQTFLSELNGGDGTEETPQTANADAIVPLSSTVVDPVTNEALANLVQSATSSSGYSGFNSLSSFENSSDFTASVAASLASYYPAPSGISAFGDSFGFQNRQQSVSTDPLTKKIEKQKVREENRERKKRWRECNQDRNKDNDLRCRVTKRANKLFGPEQSKEKDQWMVDEFMKRRAKREAKEKARTQESMPYHGGMHMHDRDSSPDSGPDNDGPPVIDRGLLRAVENLASVVSSNGEERLSTIELVQLLLNEPSLLSMFTALLHNYSHTNHMLASASSSPEPSSLGQSSQAARHLPQQTQPQAASLPLPPPPPPPPPVPQSASTLQTFPEPQPPAQPVSQETVPQTQIVESTQIPQLPTETPPVAETSSDNTNAVSQEPTSTDASNSFEAMGLDIDVSNLEGLDLDGALEFLKASEGGEEVLGELMKMVEGMEDAEEAGANVASATAGISLPPASEQTEATAIDTTMVDAPPVINSESTASVSETPTATDLGLKAESAPISSEVQLPELPPVSNSASALDSAPQATANSHAIVGNTLEATFSADTATITTPSPAENIQPVGEQSAALPAVEVATENVATNADDEAAKEAGVGQMSTAQAGSEGSRPAEAAEQVMPNIPEQSNGASSSTEQTQAPNSTPMDAELDIAQLTQGLDAESLDSLMEELKAGEGGVNLEDLAGLAENLSAEELAALLEVGLDEADLQNLAQSLVADETANATGQSGDRMEVDSGLGAQSNTQSSAAAPPSTQTSTAAVTTSLPQQQTNTVAPVPPVFTPYPGRNPYALSEGLPVHLMPVDSEAKHTTQQALQQLLEALEAENNRNSLSYQNQRKRSIEATAPISPSKRVSVDSSSYTATRPAYNVPVPPPYSRTTTSTQNMSAYVASFGNSAAMNQKFMSPAYRAPSVAYGYTTQPPPKPKRDESKVKAMGFPPMLAGIKRT